MTADFRLTSRNHGSVCVGDGPHIMWVVFKGPGSDPLLLLLVHSGSDELKLDNGALRCPRYHTALILLKNEKVYHHWLCVLMCTKQPRHTGQCSTGTSVYVPGFCYVYRTTGNRKHFHTDTAIWKENSADRLLSKIQERPALCENARLLDQNEGLHICSMRFSTFLFWFPNTDTTTSSSR